MLFSLIECLRGLLMPPPFWIRGLGPRGEYLARRRYHRRGYHLVEKHWRLGHGEIDLIMANHRRLVFVEVKARTVPPGAPVGRIISARQTRRLLRLARSYLRGLGAHEPPWNFHLVLLRFNEGAHYATETVELQAPAPYPRRAALK